MTPSNKEALFELIALSKLDKKIFEIGRKKRKLPLKVMEIQKKLHKGRSTYSDLLGEIEQGEVRRKVLEEETNEFIEKVNASKAKLYDIKTNEAYKMALKEIDNWEHEVKQRENEVLQIMEKLEKHQPEIERLQEKFKPDEKTLLKEESLINKSLESLDEEIKSIIEKREKFLSTIEPQLYQRYERIRNAKGGIALVEVNNSNCSECNLGIRPQLFNQLIKGEVVRCPHCCRMLYFISPDEKKP